MIKSVTKIVMVGLAVLLNSSVIANDESDLTQLKGYLLEKKFTQAYEYSKSLEAKLAGELSYDFLSGLAAFGAGRYQSAVFAFERVLITDPSSFDGRYYLALCYQQIDNLPAAITELETLLANTSLTNQLTPTQTSKVQYQLQWVNKKLVARTRRWSHDIAISAGSDSNINSGSSQDDITLPDGSVIPLFDSSKKTSDDSYSLQYHGHYQHPLSQYQWLSFGFSAQDKRYSNHDEYNRQMLNFSVKYKHKMVNDASWYLGLSTAPLWFAKNKYRTENALTFGWQQPINNTSQYGLNGFISNVEHSVFERLNFNRYQMTAFYRFNNAFQHTFMLKGYQDNNKAALKHNNKTAIAASYMLGYSILENLNGNTMIMYEQQKYDAPNPLFDVYSDSSLAVISTNLLYGGFEKQVIQLKLNYQNKQLEHKLPAMKIFEYDRFDINLIWKYSFL